MTAPVDYHSVYLTQAGVKPRRRWSGNGSTAFVHDIVTAVLPAPFRTCDVLYGDLPWQAGFEDYNKRAGVDDGRTYRQFLNAVSGIVAGSGRPAVLITGQHAVKHLPPADQVLKVTVPVLNQAAVALTYAVTLPTRLRTTTEVLVELASRYRRVGDFCCGYGRSSRSFSRAGGTFVASDYNPECIGFIAEHAADWDAPVKATREDGRTGRVGPPT